MPDTRPAGRALNRGAKPASNDRYEQVHRAGRRQGAGDLDGKLSAKAVLNSGIDWSARPVLVGDRREGQPERGVLGRVRKENGYATYRALTDPDDPGYRAIRHLETAE
jgi:hypothetical protein